LNDAETAIAEAKRAGIFVATHDLALPPIGRITAASPAGSDAYTHGPAPSWATACWAGRYALALQADPAITPARFLRDVAGIPPSVPE
jgi:hypothetical protein